LSLLEPADFPLLLMTSKLLVGQPFSVTSENEETIRRCKSIAHAIGATIDESNEDGITIIFLPPPLPTLQ